MVTSRPGESWITSRTLPSERSCVRLAMSALGIRLPIRRVASASGGWSRVAQPAEPDHLRADEQQITIEQPVRRLEEHPGAAAAAQVADHERVLLPRDLRVQRGQKYILGKPDVAVLPADGRVASGALEALHWRARGVEQHERDAAPGPPHAGGDASCQPGISDGSAAGGAEQRGRSDGGA